MNGNPKIGHPPEEWVGFTWLRDVIATLIEVGDGTHHRDLLYRRYFTVVNQEDRNGGNPNSFGQALRTLGCRRHLPDSWIVDLDRIKGNRPELFARAQEAVDKYADDPNDLFGYLTTD